MTVSPLYLGFVIFQNDAITSVLLVIRKIVLLVFTSVVVVIVVAYRWYSRWSGDYDDVPHRIREDTTPVGREGG